MTAHSLSKEAQSPLLLRSHRLMDAFAKSNDERDFYLNRIEGFIVYVDLDKAQEELDALEKFLSQEKENYVLLPKLTFYETKKIMEGFISEKIYDIDTKEKLLDIIQSKEARENFLEFISDHHAEFEKWQQYYQERSRIRIIEWLRQSHIQFVFEEDLELEGKLLDMLKRNLFQTKVDKDLAVARKLLWTKAKTYYSTEALNPRPKRGRPPKQATKVEVETQISADVFLTVIPVVRPFLFSPDISSASAITFSSKFDGELDLLMPRRTMSDDETDLSPTGLQQKMAALRNLSSNWVEKESFGEDEDDEDEKEEEEEKVIIEKPVIKNSKEVKTNALSKAQSPNVGAKNTKKKSASSKTISKTVASKSIKKVVPKTVVKKKPVLRSIIKTKKKTSP